MILLATLATGAAYAAQRGVFRAWLGRLHDGGDQAVHEPDAVHAEASSGVSMRPSEPFEIRLDAPVLTTVLRVLVSDSSNEISVRSSAASTRFVVDPSRLSIALRESGVRLDIDVPRSVETLTIVAGGRVLWRKDGSRIISDVVPGPDRVFVLSVPSSGPSANPSP